MVIVSKVGFALSSLSCGAHDPEVVAAPIAPHVVLIPSPSPEDEANAGSARQVAGEPAATQLACPQGTFAQHGQCIRIVASEEIPAWKPPTGQDPCATWTSGAAVYDCDPQRENAADGGMRAGKMSR
jgi:hypothetical protein